MSARSRTHRLIPTPPAPIASPVSLALEQEAGVGAEELGLVVGGPSGAAVVRHGGGRPLRVREVAAAHIDAAAEAGEPGGVLVGERRHPHPVEDVVAGSVLQHRGGPAVQPGGEVGRAIEHEQELRHPDGAELHDPDPQTGVPVEDAVEDQVGQRHRRRDPQERRLDHRHEGGVVVVEGVVEHPRLVGHVEHRGHAVLDERRPQPLVSGVRQGPPVDGGGGDHGEADAGRAEGGQLRLAPVGIAQGQVADRVDAAAAVGHHRGAAAVPGGEVGQQGREVIRQGSLPEQAEVGKGDGCVEPGAVEPADPGGGIQ